jgi:hypothetical protein
LLAWASPAAHADLTISAAIGGAPTGVTYVNFDNMAPGDLSGVSNGVTVTATADGQAVLGSLQGVYAAPFLSNSNGVPFGDNQNGPDTTTYLTTGLGSITLTFPNPEQYVGLLWGSVDNYNTLSFYNGNTLVGTVTGTQVDANANGDQGAFGTYYVNIDSTVSFTSVVATSNGYAFEFDNVAYNSSPADIAAVPEPSTFVIGAFAALGMITYGRLRKARYSSASVS